MNAVKLRVKSQVLPPWLWLWLIVYILSLPMQIVFLWMPMVGDVVSGQPQPGEALSPFVFFFRLANFAELAPLACVALGVASIFIPQRRCQGIERAYGLMDSPQLVAASKIGRFISSHSPRITVKINLLRTDQLAFIYPLGYRRTAMAIFGGIVKLWRHDQQAAEAILLHEMAHHRQGDALVIRSGNFFVDLLDHWVPLLSWLVVLPMTAAWVRDAIYFIFWDSNSLPSYALVWHKFNQLFTIFLPGLILVILGMFFWTASILVLPLIGIWSAEFSADRFAIHAQGSTDGLLRGIHLLDQPTHWRRWLLSQMSHPPNELRRWLAVNLDKPIGAMFPVLLFPLAYVGKLIFLLLRSVSALIAYQPIMEIKTVLAKATAGYLQAIASVWWTMILVLALWSWLAIYWEYLFCGSSCARVSAQFHGEYILGALVLIGIWIVLHAVV